MELNVALLVIASAILHPMRELLIKGNAYPEGLAFAVMLQFGLYSSIQVLVTGVDPWAALAVLPFAVISSVSVIIFYLLMVMTLQRGDMSVYYPITRSSPLFVVVVGYLFLDQRYSITMLTGIAIVLISAFFLQFKKGARLLDAPMALVLAIGAMSAHGVITLADAEAMRSVNPEQFFFLIYLMILPGMALVFWLTCPADRSVKNHLVTGWRLTPGRYLIAGVGSYLSYYLILTAFNLGGNVAAVASLRQVSIPVSVILGSMVLGERYVLRRLAWSALLAVGVAIILVAR